LRGLRLRHGKLGGRRRTAATATQRGVEDDGTRRVDGKQRENCRYRRHHHDAGDDATCARLLHPAVAEPPVAAGERIFGKLLVGLFLVVGEEKRNLLVRRYLFRLHIRPVKRQRKRLLVLRLLVLGLLIVLRLGLISQLLPQLLVSSLIGFIQPRIADGFVEPVERISWLRWQPGILRHDDVSPLLTQRRASPAPTCCSCRRTGAPLQMVKVAHGMGSKDDGARCE
jgi:hypothetical protein